MIGFGAMTGEQALAQVRQTLAAFDVKGPFRNVSVGRYGVAPKADNWMATVSAGGAVYVAYFDEHDRLRATERSSNSNPHQFGTMSPADVARTERWLAKVHPLFAVRPRLEGYDAATRFFEATVAGYPFVDPVYGYTFSIDRGVFVRFTAREALPPMGPAVLRVERDAAERAAEATFRSYYQPGRVEYRLVSKWTRLAWLTTDAPEARLVWCVSGEPRILGGSWSKSPSPVTLFYDAATGHRLERRVRF